MRSDTTATETTGTTDYSSGGGCRATYWKERLDSNTLNSGTGSRPSPWELLGGWTQWRDFVVDLRLSDGIGRVPSKPWNRLVLADGLVYAKVLFCLICVIDVVQLWPDRREWFLPGGVDSATGASDYFWCLGRLGILGLYPNLATVDWFLVSMAVAASLFCLGVGGRSVGIWLWLCCCTVPHRAGLIMEGEDTVLNVLAFMFAFGPRIVPFTFDWHQRRFAWSCPLIPVWFYWLWSFQIGCAYLSTSIGKASGSEWISGRAVSLVMSMDKFGVYPLPFSLTPLGSCVYTWGTLFTEFMIGVCYFVPSWRSRAALAGVCLHLGMGAFMSLGFFPLAMVALLFGWMRVGDLIEWIELGRKAVGRIALLSHLDGRSRGDVGLAGSVVLMLIFCLAHPRCVFADGCQPFDHDSSYYARIDALQAQADSDSDRYKLSAHQLDPRLVAYYDAHPGCPAYLGDLHNGGVRSWYAARPLSNPSLAVGPCNPGDPFGRLSAVIADYQVPIDVASGNDRMRSLGVHPVVTSCCAVAVAPPKPVVAYGYDRSGNTVEYVDGRVVYHGDNGRVWKAAACFGLALVFLGVILISLGRRKLAVA